MYNLFQNEDIPSFTAEDGVKYIRRFASNAANSNVITQKCSGNKWSVMNYFNIIAILNLFNKFIKISKPGMHSLKYSDPPSIYEIQTVL